MVRIWEATARQMIGKPLPQRGPVRSLAFSPDSRLLVAGCAFLQDGTWRGQARLWDVATGKTTGQALRHSEGVTAVAFSSDGRLVATGSHDHTARFWEAISGRPMGPPLEHPGDVESVEFSPDGKSLAARCVERSEASQVRNTTPATLPGIAPTTMLTTRNLQDPAGGIWQFNWRTPAPAEGTVDQLAVWAEVVSGLELDTNNVVHRLDDQSWLARRQKLESQGQPSMP